MANRLEKVETMDFVFLGSKITADGKCSHEIKRHLLLGRKVMTSLDSTLKSRDITLPTKVTYLGVQITHGSRRLSSDRVQGIPQLPSPTTRKQL